VSGYCERWKAARWPRGSPAGELRVVREGAEQPLVLAIRAVRARPHEQVSADEGTLPRLTHAAEHLLPVTPAARSIDAYLEGLQLLGDARREVHVVGRQAGHQAPVAGIHGREQLGLGVHADDGVEGTERL